MIPVIAIVGRPNVGKSTLYNCLTKSRDALVVDVPGVTRDRLYGDVLLEDKPVMVVDTGGLGDEDAEMATEISSQTRQAIIEADMICFVVDARQGLNAQDEKIAQFLRTQSKLIVLVVNKMDGLDEEIALADFYSLGFDDIQKTAASHRRGIQQLSQHLASLLPEPEAQLSEADDNRNIKVAIVGRPNVGKSTLVNRLLGEERVVVYDMPGTTRDSITISLEKGGQRYQLIDTAGVRRRKNVRETIEKFSIVKSLQAVHEANVVITVIDAQEDITDQDCHLLGYVLEVGRALVIAVNKWDNLDEDHKEHIKRNIQRKLMFVDFAKIHFISAKHGTGVGHLFKSVNAAYRSAMTELSTSALTQILQTAISKHPPPTTGTGKRPKLRLAHPGGANPPTIVIHGSLTEKIPNSYQRYLEKTYRAAFKLSGTPVRIILRDRNEANS